MNLTFYKYQATGNDFIMIDNRAGNPGLSFDQEKISFLCHRRFGIGADGLILLSPSDQYDFRMVYFNSDGRESTMCGNGGRSLVAFAWDLGIRRDEYSFDAVDGLHTATISDGIVSLEMIRPQGFRRISDSEVWLDTGSPHYVEFSEIPVNEQNVFQKGRTIRYSADYESIGGTNANFVNVISPDTLKVRTYERGVEDETYSCGTGVTACAYAHLLQSPNGLNEISVKTMGGDLSVRVENPGTEKERVFLQGPAKFVFQGEVEV